MKSYIHGRLLTSIPEPPSNHKTTTISWEMLTLFLEQILSMRMISYNVSCQLEANELSYFTYKDLAPLGAEFTSEEKARNFEHR